MMCLVASGAAVALVAIMGAESQSVVGGGARVTNRAQAGFEHPNVLAFYLVLTLPLALALGVTGPVRPRPVFLATAALITSGLVLTSTRGALVGVALALLVLLAGTPYRRMAIGFVTVIAVVAVLNPSTVLERPEVSVVGTRLSTIATGKETSTNPRIEIWEKAPEIIANYPLLGVGEGNFAPVSLRYGLYDVDADGLPYDHAHNIFLTVTAELGLVGLGLLLFVVFSVFRTLMFTLRDREAPEFLPALALTAALVGIVANGMTDYPPRTNVIMAVILLEIGLLIALERSISARKAEPTPSPH
jgi:O-antigen ligase